MTWSMFYMKLPYIFNILTFFCFVFTTGSLLLSFVRLFTELELLKYQNKKWKNWGDPKPLNSRVCTCMWIFFCLFVFLPNQFWATWWTGVKPVNMQTCSFKFSDLLVQSLENRVYNEDIWVQSIQSLVLGVFILSSVVVFGTFSKEL